MKQILLLIGALFINQLPIQSDDQDIYVARYRGDKVCAVSYTFDDGLAEHYTLVVPQLEKRGFRGTFFINGSKINQDKGHLRDTTRVTWSQLKDMAERGHEISNHGWAHRNFARFPLDILKEDILKNDSAIYACTGIMPRTFAYPNNNKSEPGLSFVEKNRVGTRIEQRSVGSKRTLEDLNGWLDALIQKGSWGVGMTHGLTYGYDAFRNPQRLWEHWEYVKKHKDKVWVGTFREVAAYIKEREEVKITIDRHETRIYISPELELEQNLFTEYLTMVICNKEGKNISVKQRGKKLPVEIRNGKVLFDFNPYGGKITVSIK